MIRSKRAIVLVPLVAVVLVGIGQTPVFGLEVWEADLREARVAERDRDLERARSLLERAVGTAEAVLDDGDPRLAAALDDLARIHESLRDWDEAARVLNLAVDVAARSSLTLPKTQSARLARLSLALGRVGRYHDAEEVLRRQVEYLRSTLGPDHVELSHALGQLAARAQRNRPEAPEIEALLTEALEVAERAAGPESQVVAMRLMSLATYYRIRGQRTRAIEADLRALAIREALSGEDSRVVFRDLARLGGELRATRDMAQAERFLTRAVTIGERTLGSRHSDLEPVLRSLGWLYLGDGRPDEALALAERALEIAINAWGHDSTRAAAARTLLDRALAASGRSGTETTTRPRIHGTTVARPPSAARELERRAQELAREEHYDDAEALLLEALALREQEAGADSLEAFGGHELLAWLAWLRGRRDESIELHRRGVEILERATGDTDPRVADRYAGIGRLLQQSARFDEAVDNYSRAVEIRESLGRPTPELARWLQQLAAVQRAAGLTVDAVDSLVRAAEVWEIVAGRSAPEIARTRLQLANAYIADRRYGAAEAVLDELWAEIEYDPARDPGLAADIVRTLGRVYAETGRDDEAAEAFRKAAELDVARHEGSAPKAAEALRRYATQLRRLDRAEDARDLESRAGQLSGAGSRGRPAGR